MLELWRKLRGCLRRDSIEAELREEMETHIAMKASDSGDWRAARRQFGHVPLLVEDSQAVWGWPRLEGWFRDCRFAVRVLRRRPAFTAAVTITLALGIGASSTVFSLVDTILFRPLPYPDPERLVALNEAKLSDLGTRTPVSPARLEDWDRLGGAFESLAGSFTEGMTETTRAAPTWLSGARVSPRFFTVLGTSAALGRVFTPEEERFGGPMSIVISDGLWRRRFSADPKALGKSLVLSGRRYSIVGIMPPSFQYPSPEIEVWVPNQTSPDLLRIREARFFDCIGRLKPGVTLAQARSDLVSVQESLGRRFPKTDAGWSVVVEPLKVRLVGGVRSALWLLSGSVGLLLLIACANVACLLLARLTTRAPELATRCSFGAGRAVIARQLFIEGLAMAVCGSLLGVTAAFTGIVAFRNQLPEVPRVNELTLDLRTLFLLVSVAVTSAVLFSLGPILHTFRKDMTGSLIRGGRGSVGSDQRWPRFLVSTQLALATLLLIVAGLFLRSLLTLQEEPLGFQPKNVLSLRVGASFGEDPEATVQRHRRIMEAIREVPGVTAVAMSAGLPGVNPSWPREFEVEGEPSADGTLRFANWRIVTDGYFETLGISILRGRTCRMQDGPERPFEALVNQSFADRYFQGRDPLGHFIRRGPQGEGKARVVGVVADAREDGSGSPPKPMIYACGYLRFWPDSDFLIASGNPTAVVNSVRRAIQVVDRSHPVYALNPLPAALRGALSETRFRTVLVAAFSIMALALAAIGLYGVLSYMVARRRREIGIRVALGARPTRIVGEVMRSGGVLAVSGTAAGVGLAVAASRLLGALLYGVSSSDPATYLSAIALLFVVALLACLIPSLRAVSIDPVEALRDE